MKKKIKYILIMFEIQTVAFFRIALWIHDCVLIVTLQIKEYILYIFDPYRVFLFEILNAHHFGCERVSIILSEYKISVWINDDRSTGEKSLVIFFVITLIKKLMWWLFLYGVRKILYLYCVATPKYSKKRHGKARWEQKGETWTCYTMLCAHF